MRGERSLFMRLCIGILESWSEKLRLVKRLKPTDRHRQDNKLFRFLLAKPITQNNNCLNLILAIKLLYACVSLTELFDCLVNCHSPS